MGQVIALWKSTPPSGIGSTLLSIGCPIPRQIAIPRAVWSNNVDSILHASLPTRGRGWLLNLEFLKTLVRRELRIRLRGELTLKRVGFVRERIVSAQRPCAFQIHDRPQVWHPVRHTVMRFCGASGITVGNSQAAAPTKLGRSGNGFGMAGQSQTGHSEIQRSTPSEMAMASSTSTPR